MNEILQKWLDEKQTELDASKKKNKEAHLRRLGLIDETKSVEITSKKSVDENGEVFSTWDPDRQLYFKSSCPVIEVSDAEYELICKIDSDSTMNQQNVSTNKDYSAEKTLKVLGVTSLILGILSFIFLMLFAFGEPSFIHFLSGLGLLLISLLLWGLFKVINEISKTLKEINFKCK